MENATRLLRRRQVESRTGLKRSTIYQRLAEGTFPKQIRLGPRSVGWLASEVEAWVQARIAESRPASPDEVAREARS
jgi:prophage regulatory protein